MVHKIFDLLAEVIFCLWRCVKKILENGECMGNGLDKFTINSIYRI